MYLSLSLVFSRYSDGDRVDGSGFSIQTAAVSSSSPELTLLD